MQRGAAKLRLGRYLQGICRAVHAKMHRNEMRCTATIYIQSAGNLRNHAIYGLRARLCCLDIHLPLRLGASIVMLSPKTSTQPERDPIRKDRSDGYIRRAQRLSARRVRAAATRRRSQRVPNPQSPFPREYATAPQAGPAGGYRDCGSAL